MAVGHADKQLTEALAVLVNPIASPLVAPADTYPSSAVGHGGEAACITIMCVPERAVVTVAAHSDRQQLHQLRSGSRAHQDH